MNNVFLHSHALCESSTIGEGTRVWAFTHILPGALIGRDCNLCDHVFIENDVVVGDRVTVKCGVQLWDGITLEDDVFIGPNVTFTNDRFPRSRQYPECFARTKVKSGASIGANATILPGITIGERAMIGAGAVIVRSVPSNAIVVGNPARIVGYANTERFESSVLDQSSNAISITAGVTLTSVRGVTIHNFPRIKDIRGNLCAGEFERTVPFKPLRYFLVFDVPSAEVRGEHAHRTCHQFLVCVRGGVCVVVDDGKYRTEVRLDRPELGIHLPPLTWGVQYRYTQDAVLLVFASEYYDSNEYIRDYDEFKRLINVE